MKRIISLIMALVLLVGMLPMPAGATENNAQVTNDDVTIEGTNGFGALLSEDIQQQYERETEYSGAYSVTDLTIAGSTAVVEYGAIEEAILVVAIYSEDGLQMITSGKTTVSPDATEATVTISNMPQYFMASAFLVDTYDYSPLCDSYETPMYTKEMQELLASTIHDYDADRVLNLDADETTNFAVYAEDTIVVEERSGVNTIISANDETMTYVIGNADDTFLWLQPGDVVSYPYGENDFLFFAVAQIDVDGTTVTIQGKEMELEDVFSHVKLEGAGTMADAVVDDSVCEEGVSYGGMIDEGATYGLRRAIGGSDTIGTRQTVTIEKELENKNHSKVKISGSLTYALEVTMDFYVSKEKQFIDFKNEVSAEAAVKLTGELEWKTPLPEFAIPVLPGVTVGFEPKLVLKVTGEAQLSAKLSFITGFTYTKEEGISPVQSAGAFELKAELKVSAFIGIDLSPNASVLNDALCEFTATIPIGFLLEWKEDVSKEYGGISPPQQHACDVCVSFDVYGVISAGIELQFLNLKWLKFERTIAEWKRGLGAFYYSVDHAKFGWGKCPYLEYLVTIRTVDTKGEPVPFAQIAANGEDVGSTNGSGVLETYLESDDYTIKAVRQEGDNISKRLEVEDACTTKLVFQAIEEEEPDDGSGDGSGSTTPTEPEETFPGVFGTVNTVTVARPADTVIVGICGPYATFTYNEDSGLMTISGTGEIDKDYLCYVNSAGVVVTTYWPFFKELRVNTGITGICDNTFVNNYSMETVTLPETLTSIGYRAFYNCRAIKTLKIRGALTSVGDQAFYENLNLTNVYLADGTTKISQGMFDVCNALERIRIPDSVETIGSRAFASCYKLKDVKLPGSLTEIGDQAFLGCESITSIRIPDKTKIIGEYAFTACRGMNNLYIPEGVTTIETQAFSDCTSLTKVKLPDSVTNLGDGVFFGCSSLERVTFPAHITSISKRMFADCDAITSLDFIEGFTSIGQYAFDKCDGLVDLVIPDSVTTIDSFAFQDCANLKSVRIPDSITKVPGQMFQRCSNLTTVELPDTLSEIGNYAFSNCTGLQEVTIPDSVTAIRGGAFSGCTSLEKVTLPVELCHIEYSTFENCTVLKEIKLPESIGSIGSSAFKDTSLESVELNSFIWLGEEAFLTDTLKEVWFLGYIPQFAEYVFSAADCVGFYPAENESWTYENLQSLPGLNIKEWHPYTVNANGERIVDWNATLPGLEEAAQTIAPAVDATVPTEETIPEVTVAEETIPETTVPEKTIETVPEIIPETTAATVPETVAETAETQPEETEAGETLLSALLSPFALQASAAEVDIPNPESPEGVFGGEYGAEDVGTYTLRTATFYDLVPGEQYVLLDMVSISGSDPLTASNLLSIDQGTADSSGTLVFEYVQRQDYTSSYIVACGPSNQDLNEAFVTFPDMEATGELQAINPTVDYYGDILKEGQDYVLLGQVSFEEAGEYVCFVRGINQYTGLVKCTYTVGGTKRGDFNADEKVDEQDAIYLIWHTLFPETYPIKITGDMNRDGKTNDTDAAYLLWHILFPETYPL